MSDSKVGIVILNYLTYNLTIKCLKNLNKIEYKNYFVVVVDNNSPNDSYKEIKNFIKKNSFKYEVYLLKTDKNGGYSYGNNVGIKKAEELKASYILIMNNDILIKESDFLNKLVNYLNKNQKIAMIGPGIIQKKNMIELPLLKKRITPFKYIMSNILYPFKIIFNKMSRKKMQSYQRPIKVYSVSGCCFIIRSKIFEEINYFDSNVFLFGEEYILGEKLYKKDYDVYFMPNLHVFHNHSTTIGSVYNLRRTEKLKIKSHEYYLKMYRKDISNIVRNLMIYSDYFREIVYITLIILIKKILNNLRNFIN